ncbi:glycosyl hydrolase family 18 protein [Streptomyces sp. NPDC048560]|uniref:glycosyl hydrolase family 18 protein n=1 Tax=Streptomyces sp. NPDC048560 TaxID=3155488 RepID=UPI0034404854
MLRRSMGRAGIAALAVVLLAGLASVPSAGAEPRTATVTAAAAVTATASAGPPVEGLFYIENELNGHNLSGSSAILKTEDPKGDEDNQQWEFDLVAGTANYKVKNPTKEGLCLAKGVNEQGEGRVVLRDCTGPGTDWLIKRHAGEQYTIFAPGSAERLIGGPRAGEAVFAGQTDESEKWYVTPIDPPRQPMPADPTFDQQTFLTTHNAFYNEDDADGAAPLPAQPHSIATQLTDGVRGLMLDAHMFNGRVRMCHEVCIPTAQPMSDVFGEIANFLKANPREIVTVFVEDYASTDALREEVGDDLGAGGVLDGLLFRPDADPWQVRTKGWPKVSELIAKNKRLLLFTDSTRANSGAAKAELGFMYGNEWTAENYWEMGGASGEANWSCYSRWNEIPLSREEKGFRRLFVMNHFRESPIIVTPAVDNAKIVNRAQRFCTPAARKKPSFISVNTYDEVSLTAVKELNTYTYHGDTPGFGGTFAEPGVGAGVGTPAGDPYDYGDGSPDDGGTRPARPSDQAQCRPDGMAASTTARFCDAYQSDGREWLGEDRDRRVIGYFSSWRTGAKGDPRYLVKNIPWNKVTHVNYAFAGIVGNQISVGDTTDAKNASTGMTWPGVVGAEMDPSLPYQGHFNLLTRYKKQHPRVKTLISVGGWAESAGFYTMTTNADGSVNQAAINTFADSVTGFLARYGFDGVDLDYEYPSALPQTGNPKDWPTADPRRKGLGAGYNALMKTVRAKLDSAGAGLNRYYLLTSAGSGSGYLARGLDAGQALQYQDFVNVMTYDLHGSWNKYVGPQAPLYDDGKDAELAEAGVYKDLDENGDPNPYQKTGYFNVDWAYHYYRGALPPGRINLGLPYYTRGWRGVEGGTDGLWGTAALPDQNACPAGTGTGVGGEGNKTACGQGATGIDNIWHDIENGRKIEAGTNPLWHTKNLQAGTTPGYLSTYGLDTAQPANQLAGTYAAKYNDTLKASWLWNAQKKVFLSTEDERSIDAKAAYVKDNGIGGVMIWEMAGDYHKRVNGEYGMGHDLTTRLDTALRAAGPYKATRAGSTVLPAQVLNLKAELVDYPTDIKDMWPLQPKLRITNNTGKTLPAGTEVSFDIPTSTSPLLKDQAWKEMKGELSPGRTGANVGGLKADFHRVTITLGYCEDLPTGKARDIGIKYYLPITGPANFKIKTGGTEYGLFQDMRKGTTLVAPPTPAATGCQAEAWDTARTYNPLWAPFSVWKTGTQWKIQDVSGGNLLDHPGTWTRAHLWAGNGGANQLWTITADGGLSGSWLRIKSTTSGHTQCLGAGTRLANLSVTDCVTGSKAQEWRFLDQNGNPLSGIPADGIPYSLASASGFVAEPKNSGVLSGTALVAGAPDGTTRSVVSRDGYYWKAKYWTKADIPNATDPNSPWTRLGPTP